jgi:hypothetical protein
MTATVTVKARAWPVTIKVSDDADPITVAPWQEQKVHVDSSLHLTITEVDALRAYAAAIGLAFQVVDDILDASADSATLGKTAGKDAANNKPTYVSLLGHDESLALAEKLRQDAHSALKPFGDGAQRLARRQQLGSRGRCRAAGPQQHGQCQPRGHPAQRRAQATSARSRRQRGRR